MKNLIDGWGRWLDGRCVRKLWSYGALISQACQVYRDPNMSTQTHQTNSTLSANSKKVLGCDSQLFLISCILYGFGRCLKPTVSKSICTKKPPFIIADNNKITECEYQWAETSMMMINIIELARTAWEDLAHIEVIKAPIISDWKWYSLHLPKLWNQHAIIIVGQLRS